MFPKIAIGAEPSSEISLDFDWEALQRSPDENLDLAVHIASERGFKLLICVDEFQNLSEFKEPQSFQKKLRTHWQRHAHVAYCLYGSKRHMMLEFFTHSSQPFYDIGNLLMLQKIAAAEWVTFFKQRFADTGKP